MAENQDSAALLNGSAMKPDTFDGTKSKYIAWKTQMKLYVVTQRKRLPEQFDRVLMILSYMKGGHAGEYVATFMKKYDADENSVIQTTKTLWEDLDRHFLIDEQAEAYNRLQAMQMGTLSAQEFFSKFELCAFQANIHDFEAHFQELKSLLEKALRADIIRLLYNSSEELPATYALYKQRVARIDLNQQQDSFNQGSSRRKTHHERKMHPHQQLLLRQFKHGATEPVSHSAVGDNRWIWIKRDARVFVSDVGNRVTYHEIALIGNKLNKYEPRKPQQFPPPTRSHPSHH
ncbi:uncharacterized protein PHACADRAFT_202949 [Phanerochaete carnosa HHB-10118-sp]|uniref:Retrotransposon gag domain-containing protein n=1 Tax=Phanerochaete carnosa (strain HHB-10118-sp) TaxID=650164 RepID=K5VBA1_PHACS|nr:uncharacterized protein PHACADRAFT_202949 [Phanerochaete carnosa HHB-10118-sp]EKM48333.1 hypothetical protein PHACADRAFT_202949 [Phanerochaete carnosa HHB-10118-sp]